MTTRLATTAPPACRAAGDNLLAANIEYGYGLGWSFTPLTGKRPTLKSWPTLPRETLAEALAWAAQGNVGLRTGAVSGVVVIDADPGADLAPLDLPATITARTGRDGQHLYYRYTRPVGNSTGKLGPHIDVRGDGGQVVYPGSVHPETGRRYEWAEGLAPWQVAIAELPAHILERLNGHDVAADVAHVGPTLPRTANGDRYVQAALEGELGALRAAAEGQRNETLNKAAFSLGTLVGGGHLNRQEVEQALQTAAEAVGLEPEEVKATVRSGLDSGVQQPPHVPDRQQAAAAPAAAAGNQGDDALLYDLTDAGNAAILAHLFGDRLRFDHLRGRWLVWAGHWWAHDADGEPPRLALEAARWRAARAFDLLQGKEANRAVGWAVGSRNRQRIDACLWVGRHLRPVADAGAGWDADPMLLGAANGVVDLRLAALRDGRPEDRVTMHSPVAFDPDAACPRWLQFLDEIFESDDKLVEFVRRACGYSLTGLTVEQVFFILFGSGANGKSVFLSTLRYILGPYAYDPGFGVFEAATRFAPHPEQLAVLAGRRLVTANETAENTRLNETRLKVLSHGDATSARFMHESRFEFTPTCKVWLGVNHKPQVHDDSLGFWRSVRLIPFNRRFLDDADRHLVEKLRGEAPGILAWAVRSCLEWQTEGLGLPEAVAAATREYGEESDPLANFMAARCVVGPTCWAAAGDLYRSYLAWAADEGMPERSRLTPQGFGRRIGGRFKRDTQGCGNNRVRVYLGIGLLTAALP